MCPLTKVLTTVLFGTCLTWVVIGCQKSKAKDPKDNPEQQQQQQPEDQRVLGPLTTAEACQEKQEFFQSQGSVSDDIESYLTQILSNDVDIVLIGDEHSTHESETMNTVSRAFEAAKNPPDCMFIEKARGTEYDLALRTFFDGDSSALSNYDEPSWFMRWNGDMQSFISYMSRLRDLGVQVYSIEDKSATTGGGSALENLNRRDGAMAKNIMDLYESKKCSKAVLSVGAMHILKTMAGKKRKTLYHLLEETGLRVSNLLLLVAGKLSSYSPSGPARFPNQNSYLGGHAHWSTGSNVEKGDFESLICESTLKIPKSPYLFRLNKAVDAPLLFFPLIRTFGLESEDGSDFYGRYADFDFIWVHSCQEASCKQENDQTMEGLSDAKIELYEPKGVPK